MNFGIDERVGRGGATHYLYISNNNKKKVTLGS